MGTYCWCCTDPDDTPATTSGALVRMLLDIAMNSSTYCQDLCFLFRAVSVQRSTHVELTSESPRVSPSSSSGSSQEVACPLAVNGVELVLSQFLSR